MAVDICPCSCDPPYLDEPASTHYTEIVQSRLRLGLACLMIGQEPRTLEIKTKQNKTAYIITMWSFSVLAGCLSEAVRRRNRKRLTPATAPPPEHG